jgi:hypothetical protein
MSLFDNDYSELTEEDQPATQQLPISGSDLDFSSLREYSKEELDQTKTFIQDRVQEWEEMMRELQMSLR